MDALRGALGGIEHAEDSFPKVLCARRHDGALGKDAEALVSPQREALTGFAAGGAAGWHALIALSLAKARFVGKESIKLDRAEEVMVAGGVKKLQKIFYESYERRTRGCSIRTLFLNFLRISDRLKYYCNVYWCECYCTGGNAICE
jgi:hypothetical protein